MSDKVQEGLQQLSELIRQLNGNLIQKQDDWHTVYHRDIMNRLYGKKPKCFLKLKRAGGGPMGRNVETYILPICNRAGFEDPNVIAKSIIMIKKIMDSEEEGYDINDLKKVLGQLQHYHNVYSKPVPHPPKAAAKKAMVTRMFHKIRGHLNRGL
jgi:hypothetical protein